MKNIILLIFTFLIIDSSYAQSTKQERIENLLSSMPQSTTTAIFIYNPLTDDTLFQQNINRSMIPASNTKLFTTAVALDLMGAEYKISTRFLIDDADISDSVIDGNLYIKGYGNSTVTEHQVDSICSYLYSQGIRKITGKIIGDDSYFDQIYSRKDWIEDERANISLPPVSALSLNRNSIIISLDANKKIGSNLDYQITPNCNFINVKMSARVTKFRTYPRIHTQFTSKKININVAGGLRHRRYPGSYAIYVESPPLFFAQVVDDKLKKMGVSIGESPDTSITPFEAIEIAKISIPLFKYISETNKQSENYYAENLFKIIGAEFSGKQGNSFYSTQAVLTFIENNQISDIGTSIVDGSGISRFNEITTSSIVDLLTKMYFNDNLYNTYFNSLSVAGIDGTLEDRFDGTFLQNNLHGKTGTLRGVSALSGYFTTKNDDDLIVSIIMEYRRNGISYYRNIQDRIVEIAAE
jgi:PBP4 family serine-type D-alanyl-D-alanine carboxypeptidase